VDATGAALAELQQIVEELCRRVSALEEEVAMHDRKIRLQKRADHAGPSDEDIVSEAMHNKKPWWDEVPEDK
jgi:hypothetical protein